MDAALSILPHFALRDAALFLAWSVAVAWLPGLAIRRLAGWNPPGRPERWALTAILGTLWASWTYWLLALLGRQHWHLAVAIVPAVAWVALAFRQYVGWAEVAVADGGASQTAMTRNRRPTASHGLLTPPYTTAGDGQPNTLPLPPAGEGRGEGRWNFAELLGLLLIAAFILHHLVRVSACIVPDQSGVRLYGALYSDKLTPMSACASLIHGVPPRHLRMSGEVYPYHYFPHLFIAAAFRATGVDYPSGFWFHAAALGILVSGLAVLAFSRQALGSYALGLVGLTYYGLTQFTTEARPLDLSIPMLLLGIVAVDRFQREGGRRWAVLLWASMPLYEAFHSMALLGALAVWWAAAVWRRVRARTAARGLWLCTAVAVAALLGTLLSTRALTLGARQVTPTKLVLKNSYRESYRDEWLAAVRSSGDRPNWSRTLLRWKRAKDPGPDGETPLPPQLRPNLLQRIAGELVYDAGFVAYLVLRFLNVGLLGLIALGKRGHSPFAETAQRVLRTNGGCPLFHDPACWRPIEALSASIAAVGFGLPMVLTWGHVAEGRWWETPNLYRLTTCANLLLVLLGSGVFVIAIKNCRRPRWWLPLGLAALQLYALLAAALQAPTSFHHVDRDRLAALAFLRREVPFGQTVIHPWFDDLIRDTAAPDRIAWVYKRHFALGSNLAGQQMYYEGREDHLFIGGFITPESVYLRLRLRRKFYDSPDPATVSAILAQNVRWVVADQSHPAPPEIQAHWPLAFQSGSIRIYSRGA